MLIKKRARNLKLVSLFLPFPVLFKKTRQDPSGALSNPNPGALPHHGDLHKRASLGSPVACSCPVASPPCLSFQRLSMAKLHKRYTEKKSLKKNGFSPSHKVFGQSGLATLRTLRSGQRYFAGLEDDDSTRDLHQSGLRCMDGMDCMDGDNR